MLEMDTRIKLLLFLLINFMVFGLKDFILGRIYDAMKLRGIALSWKNVFTRPLLLLEAMVVPIVMRSASIADELSASAVTRGIDNPDQRTSFVQLKVTPKDIIVLVSFVIAFVALFYAKYQIYGRI